MANRYSETTNAQEKHVKIKRLIVITQSSIFSTPIFSRMISKSIFDAVTQFVIQIKNKESMLGKSGYIWIAEQETGITAKIFGNENWTINIPSNKKMPDSFKN